MDQNALKEKVAQAAIDALRAHPTDQLVLGVGTGSTTEYFIHGLANIRDRIDVPVSSSDRSTALLEALGFKVVDLNAAPRVDLYVDGADEANHRLQLIKGGGARVNDAAVSNEMQAIGTSDMNADGFIKLTAGKKRHVLVLAG